MSKAGRKLVVVSGYYGFNNLGDEAILEELLSELKTLVNPQDILVLSQDPEATSRLYGVPAINRWQIGKIAAMLGQCRLFISGGGGLFQDTGSIKSVIYYGGLINIARLSGAPVMVYAQGLGPLHKELSRFLTRQTFKRVNAIAVRDPASQNMLNDWHIKSTMTGDPVWLLAPGTLPGPMAKQLSVARHSGKLLLALSLRDGGGFNDNHIECLASILKTTVKIPCIVLPLALQPSQDKRPLEHFKQCYTKLGGEILELDLSSLEKPSQWLTLMGTCDLVIGMRLHSLIMSLSRLVPVIGIAYDPKVQAVMAEFDQPTLPYLGLTDANCAPTWQKTLSDTVENLTERKTAIAKTLEQVKGGACQNQAIIAKMLAQ